MSSFTNKINQGSLNPWPMSNVDSALEASYQRWIGKQLELKSLDYSELHKLALCCCSWNVNARELGGDSDLRSWLLHKSSPPADIYVIGLQEIVDLNITNVMLNNGASDDRSAYWQTQITNVLRGSGVEYGVLAERHMVGLQVLVFCRLSLRSAISDIRLAHTYTGGYGVTGNKGGISVRFDVFDSPLCFVCAHFHANRENVEQRNLDFHTILETTVFPPVSMSGKRPSVVSMGSGGASTKSAATAAATTGGTRNQRPYSINMKNTHNDDSLSILQHEHIFWLGDLNYRIIEDLEEELVFDLVHNGQWAGLRSKDQLSVEREKGNVFQNFEEGTISFPPTYKFQPGTNVYEQRPGKKLRAPAWCDRILWKSVNKSTMQLLSYRAAPIHVSDHKPISAWFECGVRKVIQERVREVYQELLFAVDKWINASTPKLSLEKRMYDFGKVGLNVSICVVSWVLLLLFSSIRRMTVQ
jgi:inositol polyphosphate 5-phosphatase INPP5B/F